MSVGNSEGPQSFFPGGAIQLGAAVKLSAADTVVVATSATTERVLGVAVQAASASSTTQKIAVECRRGMIVMVKASTTIAADADLTVTTAGEALTTTTAGNRIYAKALAAAGAADELIPALLVDWIVPA